MALPPLIVFAGPLDGGLNRGDQRQDSRGYILAISRIYPDVHRTRTKEIGTILPVIARRARPAPKIARYYLSGSTVVFEDPRSLSVSKTTGLILFSWLRSDCS